MIIKNNDKEYTQYQIRTDIKEIDYRDDKIKETNIRKTRKYNYVDISIYKKYRNVAGVFNYIFSIDKYKDNYARNAIALVEYADRLNNPSKELSESASVIRYVNNQYNGLRDKTNVVAYIMSDGIIGLTGYTLYISTKWRKIISFDPLVKENKIYGRRFYTTKNYDYDIDIIDVNNDDIIIIYGIHSHGNTQLLFDRMKDKYKNHRFIIAVLPCCFLEKTTLQSIEPKCVYMENSILSDKNTIYLYDGIF